MSLLRIQLTKPRRIGVWPLVVDIEAGAASAHLVHRWIVAESAHIHFDAGGEIGFEMRAHERPDADPADAARHRFDDLILLRHEHDLLIEDHLLS